MTKEFSRYVFDVGVAYREDVDEIIEVLKGIDVEMRNDPEYKDDILEPLEILGLNEFANSAVVIRARTTTLPIKQWRVGREFNRRLKKKFDQLNIEIPFPHMTLYLGQDKQGHASPLRVVPAKVDMEKNPG
jgi:small conductance mechanosensitive channel